MEAGGQGTRRNCCHKTTLSTRLTPPKKKERKSLKKKAALHLLTLRWVALHLQNWEFWSISKLSSLPYMPVLVIFRCLLRCLHQPQGCKEINVHVFFPQVRMTFHAGFLIVIPFLMQNELHVESMHLGSRLVFTPFHSSVTSTPSSFRGFSSCFLSCHCESVWEVW